MVRVVDNVHVREFEPLISPRLVKEALPITDSVSQMVYEARQAIRQIIHRQDRRLLVVIGPCSIHDPRSALEYAERLATLKSELSDRMLIVMRVYLEKPRTTVGWRGLLNDPKIDGSYDMNEGVRLAREMLLEVSKRGLPTAVEMLDPISPQYMSDLVCLAAIGARTVESQTHRALASGLSMPVGYKNGTDGNLQSAVNAYLSASQRHSFLGIDQEGQSAIVQTMGNPDGIVILRGGRAGPNYDAATIEQAEAVLQAAGLPTAVMVDCSHANAGSDYTRQAAVWESVLRHRLTKNDGVIGMMVESHLFAGKQAIPADLTQLRYGVSITDACIGWETTEQMLRRAYDALGQQA